MSSRPLTDALSKATTTAYGVTRLANDGEATAGEAVQASDGRLSNARLPSGAAGGVLGGSYPNPTFAVDMATQTELDAHAALVDTASSAPHHTLGSGPNQAAAGDHTHAGTGLLAHASTHATGGSDVLTPAAIGAATVADLASRPTGVAGLAGRVAWYSAADTLEVYANSLFRDSATGNIGIGTESPQTSLHVLLTGTAGVPVTAGGYSLIAQRSGSPTNTSAVGIISGNAGTGVITFGDTDAFVRGQIIYDHANDNLRFVTAAATRLTMDNVGRVGLSVTPLAKLHLPAGAASANNAPLKFSAGTLLTALEDGTIEYTSAGFFTTHGGVRTAFGTVGSIAWTSITGKPTTLAGYGITDAAALVHIHADVIAAGASGFMSGADKTKLNGIAAGATANSADAFLLARVNHTGTQLAATISDFVAAVAATPPAAHVHTFASLTSKPTTLAGYGITDAAALVHTHAFASLTSIPTTLAGYGITDAAALVHIHADVIAAGASGFMSGADKTKLNGIDAAAIAYKNQTNTFALAQTFTAQMIANGGLQGGLTATEAPETSGFWIPRPRDHGTFIFDDYTDELALWTYKTGRTATISAPGTGAVGNLFTDDVSTVAFAGSTNSYPIVLTIDGLTNPITAKAVSTYRLGVVFRPTQAPTVSDYVVEVWDTAGAGSWLVVQSGAWPAQAPVTGYSYLLPVFSFVVSGSSIYKLRLTLNGTNPLAATHAMRIQRVMLYHGSADWDPWHLHRLTGGEVYGAVQLLSTLGVTGALTTSAGATIGGTLGVSGKTTLSGAVAGIPRALGWYYEVLPTAATLGPVYTVDTDMTITGIAGYADIPASGSTAQFDIQYKRAASAWTTIFSSLPGFAVGANVPSGNAQAVTQLNSGDFVRLRWQGTPAGIADVTVSLNAVTR